MKKRMKTLCILGCVGILTGCGVNDTDMKELSDTTKDVVKEVSDQTANIVYSEDKYVLSVKGGHPERYSNATYGQAFEDFFAYPTWKYFKGTKEGSDEDGDGKSDTEEENVDVVEFTGYCTYQDVEVKALIQFTLNDDNTFTATYLSYNEVPQNNLALWGLLEAVFEDYEDEKGEEQMAEEVSDSLTVPKVEEFQEVVVLEGDGTSKEITWGSVAGADGYECEYTERAEGTDAPYVDIRETQECRYTVGASDPIDVSIRVRAYKNEDGKRIYSQWSEEHKCSLNQEEETGSDKYSDYTGSWSDTYSQRAFMQIKEVSGKLYVQIEWSSSAEDNTKWTFSSTNIENRGNGTMKISYQNCKEVDEYYNEDGTCTENEVSSEGTGYLYYDGKIMTWNDNNFSTSTNCTFIRTLDAAGNSAASKEYIIQDSNIRELTESDLSNLTAGQCRIARNEIYARHGRIFQDAALQQYFENCSWYLGMYSSSEFSDDMLSDVERKNLQTISDYETKMGYK